MAKRFRTGVAADLRAFVERVRDPIAVRSSSLLEGSLSHEQNFLQALPFIAREAPVIGVAGATLADTIGLNSMSDLERLERASASSRRSPA